MKIPIKLLVDLTVKLASSFGKYMLTWIVFLFIFNFISDNLDLTALLTQIDGIYIIFYQFEKLEKQNISKKCICVNVIFVEFE